MITDCKTHSGRYIKYTGITKAYIEEVRNYDVISLQEQKYYTVPLYFSISGTVCKVPVLLLKPSPCFLQSHL